jgi:GNAT superfamily N-acetyltransferase
VVAASSTTMVGVALLSHTGEVALLYVLPDARLRGVSKALLAALEDAATHLGLSELTLKSTSTAQRFYSRCGFVPAGEPTKGFGLTLGFPMSKRLQRTAKKRRDAERRR